MILNFEMYFTFTPAVIDEAYYTDAFMHARNDAVHILNDKYESWNNEYNTKYSESMSYDKFISDKTNAALEAFNANRLCKIVTTEELSGDLMGLIGDVEIRAYLKPCE